MGFGFLERCWCRSVALTFAQNEATNEATDPWYDRRSMTVVYGSPTWTSGVFGKRSAQDDLGVEEVGAGLLRRLLPGIIQNTPNAGYYSFYPYLLWKWEQLNGDVARKAFTPFYRRHESAFAVACALHDHRDGVGLTGVNGASEGGRRARELEGGQPALDLDGMAATYMDTPLGGYGLFYAAALQDARLVRGGAAGLVDRTTSHGHEVASAFADAFEGTRYYAEHFEDGGPVDADILRELGDAVCLCAVPGRADHEPLLETFFGEALEDPPWEDRRQSRVESLCLLLEFHHQRPAAADHDIGAWRRALVDPRFSDGTPWETAHPVRRNAWRAYQCREVAVLALTALWSLYLGELQGRGRATHVALRAELTSWLDQDRLGFDPSKSLSDASAAAAEALPEPALLLAEAEPLERSWGDDPADTLCRALRTLLALRREIRTETPGFSELLDEGGRHRWSLETIERWFAARDSTATNRVVGELLDELHHQHVRVALSKVRLPSGQNLRLNPGGWRDPFCFAEDDAVLRPLRDDAPFWTGARFHVLNHLLWSLGLLDAPGGDIALTDLGRDYLERYARA